MLPDNILYLARKAEFAKRCNYTPYKEQVEFHSSSARFKVIAAGARAGKSMAVGFELAFALLLPDIHCWVVAVQYELADKEFDWCLHFLAQYKLPNGKKLIDILKLSSPIKGMRVIKSPWGSWIKTKSTEKLSGLLGESLDIEALGEGAKIPMVAWSRFLRPRLGDRKGQMICGSTPSGDSGIMLEFMRLAKDKDFPEWKMWQFSTLANPTFSKEEWDKAKKELDEKDFQEQYEGLVVSRRGKVLFVSDSSIKTIKKLPPEAENWSIIRGVKVGYQNPFVCIWVVVDPKDFSYHVLKCYYETGKIITEAISDINAKFKGKKIFATLISPWSKNIETLKEYGFPCLVNEKEKPIGQNRATLVRIQAMQSLFDQGKITIYREGCTDLINEFDSCKWPEPPKEGQDKDRKEEPLPKFFRAIEALSHIVAFIEMNTGVDIYSRYLKLEENLKRGTQRSYDGTNTEILSIAD